MRNFAIVCTMLLFIAACSPIRTATPQPAITAPIVAAPSAAAQGTLPAAQPTQAATSAPAGTNTAPVALQVLSPQDDSVVNTQQVTVSGAASPGAVVTVNDDIIVVGADGQFQDTVTLDEGLNLIEVIASNTSGSETSLELTVTYEP